MTELNRILATLSLVGCLISGVAWAQDSTDPLTKIEDHLFSRNFAEQSVEERLSRVESLLFGESQSGETAQRLAKLEKVVEEFKPEVPQTAPMATQQAAPKQAAMDSPAPDATDYPAVTDLENHLFKKAYGNEAIGTRLARLENQIFKQTYDDLPMVDRVDQLTLKVFPNNPLTQEETTMGSIPSKPENFINGDTAVYSDLTSLEEQVFGQAFGGGLIGDRLTRLEMRVFGKVQTGSVDQRLSKLQAHYLNNMAQQQASIGPVQSYTPQAPQTPLPMTPPPMVQMGPGFGQGFGQQSQQFSTDMLNMLPPQVQAQIRGQGSIVGVPPQQYNYNYNYQYQGPRNYQQPGGSFYGPGYAVPYAVPYNVPYAVPYRNTPYAQPYRTPYQQPANPYQRGPYYQSVPPLTSPSPMFRQMSSTTPPVNAAAQVNQSLVLLENKIFGRSYQEQHVLQRLNTLEQQIFGHSNAQYPVQQRIDLLMKEVPYQQSFQDADPSAISKIGETWNMMLYKADKDNAHFPLTQPQPY